MTIDILNYQPEGDKKNSDFFEEYRLKIYQRRAASGLEQMLGTLCSLVVHVETDDAVPYMKELYLMTPYRFTAGYVSNTHRIYILTSHPEYPRLILLEPLQAEYEDDIRANFMTVFGTWLVAAPPTPNRGGFPRPHCRAICSKRLNRLYPLACKKPNARYVGEIFHTSDMNQTREVLESHNIRFHYSGEVDNQLFANEHFAFTFPSDFTCNRTGYTSFEMEDYDSLGIGDRFELTAEQLAALQMQEEIGFSNGISQLLTGVDHMATRILAGEREDAILEFLTVSNYYFWGAYNIAEMNSSTNVNRNHNVDDDKKSPAKVFTANNTPSFVNSFDNLPMPTEDFVRNFGRRMHHVAIEVRDGDHPSGVKNVDYVVGKLAEQSIPFLANVVGECQDDPDLKQIFSKHSQYSLLITEYVERCHEFTGFFTRQNVASLTQAAGDDERYQHGHVFD